MKWLTLTKIKAQLRIEENFHDEDTLLEDLGEVAEDAVLDIVRRTYEEVVQTYGGVPSRLRQASLMLTDHLYQNRGLTSAQTLSIIPYTYDMMLKPFMKLTYEELD